MLACNISFFKGDIVQFIFYFQLIGDVNVLSVNVNTMHFAIPILGIPKAHTAHARAKIEDVFMRQIKILADKLFVHVQMLGIVVDKIVFSISDALLD